MRMSGGMVWEKLLQTEAAQEAYRQSVFFHLIVNKVRVAETEGLDPTVYLGEVLARVSESREEWIQAASARLAQSTLPALSIPEGREEKP